MQKKRSFLRSNLFVALISLLFSIILFFNANSTTSQNTLLPETNMYEETITEVPIQTLYDQEQYFIQGFSAKATVKLRSANRIQIQTEKNEETRNFRVVADLSNLREGTHEVPLKLQNVKTGIDGRVTPTTITVTIEKKAVKKIPVTAALSDKLTAADVQLQSATVEPAEVEITTGVGTMNEIDRVVAVIDGDASSDFKKPNVTVQALNKKGEVLSVVAAPQTVTVRGSLQLPHKQVSLYASQVGTPSSGIQRFAYELKPAQVQLQGAADALASVETIAVPVDVTGVTQPTERTVSVPVVAAGTETIPGEVRVLITPIRTEESSSETRETASASITSSETTETEVIETQTTMNNE